MTDKLWGGYFAGGTDRRMEIFSSSLRFDWRLYRADITVGIAHARILQKGGYLTGAESRKIIRGLKEIEAEIDKKGIDPDKEKGCEDIHSLILERLIKKVGPAGKKLHAGRSRNDLVALDTRLFLRQKLKEILTSLRKLQRVLVRKGREHEDLIIPGYTHLQHAQPVLFVHHLLAYVEMLERDRERVRDSLKRVEVLPYGSGALAGTGLKLDQKMMAEMLNFKTVSANSLDSVSDRDFILESLAALAVIGTHLSRLAAELVLWSTSEFSFIRLDESFCTGSSFLPQKRNPDAAELVRGKVGRLYGNLMAVLTVLKGLPLSYNRDLQEDKEPLFDSLDTVKESLEIMAGAMDTLEVDRKAVDRSLAASSSWAVDLAEYLVEKGVAFKDAHRAVGKLARWLRDRNPENGGPTLDDLKKFSPLFDKEALNLLSPEASLRRKNTAGSTAPVKVKRQLVRWERKLGKK